MDLIVALYIFAILIGGLFIAGVLAEIWLWWYPGYVVRANRARIRRKYGR